MTPYHRFKANYRYKGAVYGWVAVGCGWGGCSRCKAGAGLAWWRRGCGGVRAGRSRTHQAHPCTPARRPACADSSTEKRPIGMGLWAPLEAEGEVPIHHFKVGAAVGAEKTRHGAGRACGGAAQSACEASGSARACRLLPAGPGPPADRCCSLACTHALASPPGSGTRACCLT